MLISGDDLRVLKSDILNEMEGYQFYTLAAQRRSRHAEVKQVCLSLAEWEAGHLEMLEKIYVRVKEE